MKTALILAILGAIVVVLGGSYFDMGGGSSMNLVLMAMGVALLIAAAVRLARIRRLDN